MLRPQNKTLANRVCLNCMDREIQSHRDQLGGNQKRCAKACASERKEKLCDQFSRLTVELGLVQLSHNNIYI